MLGGFKLEFIFWMGHKMLRTTFLLILLSVSACSIPPVATIGSGWVISEFLYDRSPISLASEFFSKNCDNYSLYEMPARCRPK